MITLIDNYDSFTYNLYQYLCELGAEVGVHRNDKISVDEVLAGNPEGIVISPGPCTPDQAGIAPAIPTTGSARTRGVVAKAAAPLTTTPVGRANQLAFNRRHSCGSNTAGFACFLPDQEIYLLLLG